LPNAERVLFQVQPVADNVRLRVTPDARPKDNYVRGLLASRDVLDVVEVTRGYDADDRLREWCRVVEPNRQLTGWIARSVVDTVRSLPVPAVPAVPTVPANTWLKPERIIVYLALLAALITFSASLVQRRTAADERRTAELKQSRSVEQVLLPHQITVKIDTPKTPAQEPTDRTNVVDFEQARDTRDVRTRLGIPERRTARRTSISV